MKKYKVLYDTMLENGDLGTLLPFFTGDWDTDKAEFKKTQEDLEKIIYNLDVDIDEDYYED